MDNSNTDISSASIGDSSQVSITKEEEVSLLSKIAAIGEVSDIVKNSLRLRAVCAD